MTTSGVRPTLTLFTPLFLHHHRRTDSGKVFFAGRNVFPSNASVESLAGRLQHDIAELPVELEEFSRVNEKFVAMRSGDEHFVLLNALRDKVYGWGFNSHHQLATVDPLKLLHAPDVCFETDDGEPIKFMECGKLSTCVVTGEDQKQRLSHHLLTL